MSTFNPFWELFSATYKIIFRTCHGRVQVCLGSERTTERTGESGRMQVLKHDDAMHMMTWQNGTHKQMTGQQQRITGRHLAQRSRGVATLHHYKRISSRDLGWHRGENGRGRKEVKLSCFFDKRVKPKNLERLGNLKERVQHRWTRLQTIR